MGIFMNIDQVKDYSDLTEFATELRSIRTPERRASVKDILVQHNMYYQLYGPIENLMSSATLAKALRGNCKSAKKNRS